MFRIAYLISNFLLITSVWTHAEAIQYISFSSNRTGNFDIYTIDVNGENLQNITNGRTNEAAASWSPDGRFFAYHSDADPNRNVDIYVMDIEKKKTSVDDASWR